ncbi:GGDEF domain-containing protein [Mitsuokella sp.]|uniref:GGDEF domain-containing protein n=1 Tax=Mitsuokella sp. TaxID=2049034 RepID=UPI003D7DBFC6
MKKKTDASLQPSYSITHAELLERIKGLQTVFDIVRLVDPSAQHPVLFDAEGRPLLAKDYCWCIWEKNSRCTNCISAKTLATKQKTSKFEFIDDDMYLLVSDYLEVDGRPCVLENILHLDDKMLIGAYGKNEFVSKITHYNDQVFKDSLTGVYNRRYYDEQVSALTVQAAAMLDIDHFKDINDTWRHKAGDAALHHVAQVVSSCTRRTDIFLRYGGDEFLLAFEEIPKDVFLRKLENICEAVERTEVPGYPYIHLTLSIGGVYERGPLKSVIEKADEALYEAKCQRGRVVIRV